MASKERAPMILGKRMRRGKMPDGLSKAPALTWKRGPIGVTIGPSTTGDRPDFQIWIEVFGFGVANDWRMTEELAAAWAERKLGQIVRALSGGMLASERYE